MKAETKNGMKTRVRVIDSAGGKESTAFIPHPTEDKYLAVGFSRPYPGDSLAFRYLGIAHRDIVDVLSLTKVSLRGSNGTGRKMLVRYKDVDNVPELWSYVDNPSKKTEGQKLWLTYCICNDVLENNEALEALKTPGLKKKVS